MYNLTMHFLGFQILRELSRQWIQCKIMVIEGTEAPGIAPYPCNPPNMLSNIYLLDIEPVAFHHTHKDGRVTLLSSDLL